MIANEWFFYEYIIVLAADRCPGRPWLAFLKNKAKCGLNFGE